MTLVYSIAPNGGLCFADLDRAMEVSRIHHAMRSSKTWAEFKRGIPATEYARIVKQIQDCSQPAPRGGDPFSAESVPGFSDGDYPPWLQVEMDVILPRAVLQRFGKYRSTRLNGDYHHFRPEDLDAILELLRKLGYEVEERKDLRFW